MGLKREVLYTTKEVLRYVHSVIDDCADLVCPKPHVEEERSCEDVANEIRALKTKWKNSEYVLRTTSDENVFAQRNRLLQKRNRTPSEEKRLQKLQDKILSFRTAAHPSDAEAMEFIRKAADALKRAENEQKEYQSRRTQY